MSHHRATMAYRRAVYILGSMLSVAVIGSGCPGSQTATCGGEPQTFQGGAAVTLDGSTSFDPEGRQLRFRWTQIEGAPVDLANADQAVAGFIAPNLDDTLSFQLTATDSLGFAATCEVTILVRRVCDLLASAGDDRSVNIQGSVELQGSATCGFPSYTFAWQQISGPEQVLADAQSATATVTGVVPGTSVFRLTVTDSVGSTATDEVSVEVICNVPTTITQQPTDQTVCLAEVATFTVEATGLGDVSFQWRRGTVNLVDAGRISGTTTSTLTIDAVEESDEAQNYNVVVTALCGSVTSNQVSLVLLETTQITEQPADQTVCIDDTTSFTVTATGAGDLTYQWRKGTTNITDGGHYSGATTPTLTVTGTDETDVAPNYNVVVTGQCGSVTSTNASLALLDETLITEPPSDQTVCADDTATFTVLATGTGDLTYQWRKGTTNITNGGHYSGATTPTLTVTGADETDVATNYNVVVTGQCGSVTSTNAALALLEETTITQQPTDQNPSGGEASFTVVATGAGTLTYQWQFEGIDLVESPRFLNVTTPTLTVTGFDSDVTGDYRVIVTGQCGSVTSDAASLSDP